jgi:hypothetical protein
VSGTDTNSITDTVTNTIANTDTIWLKICRSLL